MRRRSGTGKPAKPLRKTVGSTLRKRDRKPARPERRPSASVAQLQKQVATLTRELSEAREQQTASSEVLRVISRSSGELKSVFDAMLANATRVCEATFGTLYLFEGDAFRAVALHGAPPSFVEARRRYPVLPIIPGTALGRVAATRQAVQISDAQAEPAYRRTRAHAIGLEMGGLRTILSVPMLKENELVGTFNLFRQEVRPFTDKQVELVQTFADQAVIAIENTRLLNELRHRTDDLSESLEQQTATSEVLKVISNSPGELGPVFDALLANATHLCGAKFASLLLVEGDQLRRVALHNAPAALVEHWRSMPVFRPHPQSAAGRAAATRQVALDNDLRTTPRFRDGDPLVVAAVRLGGYRTVMSVPMLKDDVLVGIISIYRQEVRRFTDKQIDLVRNFAAQAVIAIENTRLLNELRQRTDDLSESLEQQTATSEVLGVISSSQGALEPVFNTMLESATRICAAGFGVLALFDGRDLRHVASHNLPRSFEEVMRPQTVIPRNALVQGVVQTKQVVHVPDVAAVEALDKAPLVKHGGVRSVIAVPMLKENKLVGAITIFRQEVRPFTDKQINLLQNFAAQAVIAIENTRLLNELRQRTDDLTESLEQQTATSEVLKVISSSPGALEPVFQAMLENAVRICDAKFGTLHRFDGKVFQAAARFNTPSDMADFQKRRGPFRPESGGPLNHVLNTKQVYCSADEAAEARPGVAARLGGARSLVAVPMLQESELVGAILIYRQEVKPFTPKQIELVQNFAAQAVIAIENTRLLNELRESLQQQTATADVLKVISRSTFDLGSVLNTLVESAVRLCEADIGNIARPAEGSAYRIEANYGQSPTLFEELTRTLLKPGKGSLIGRTALSRSTIHILDAQTDPDYELHEAQRIGDYHTMLGVPLMREGNPVGIFALARRTIRPFTDKQIELLTSFADQAVIAIENVRLFDEIQDKSRQLAEASQHKSQFLANMSHELRTPLNAILGYTELIADGVYGAPPEKMTTVLKRVESNGKHLLGLINAVLDLSKIEAGQLVLDLADYSLGDVAQTVYGAVEALAADKKLAFKAEVAPDLPRGRGDERRLTQVLLNLVGNAIKFTDAGEVVITAGASKGAYNVSVRDTGPGISAADQEKLFQEFQQADNSFTKKKGGTGLGLAISKRIIEMHGGKIWLETAVGQGSTFFVTLPIQVQGQARP